MQIIYKVKLNLKKKEDMEEALCTGESNLQELGRVLNVIKYIVLHFQRISKNIKRFLFYALWSE